MSVTNTLPPETSASIPLKIEPITPELRRRIRFPLEGFNVSGRIRVITQIANGLARRGHEVTLLVPDYQAATHFELVPTLNIEIIKTQRRGIFRKIEYVFKLIQYAARDCDICAATSSRTPLYIMASLWFTRSRPKLMYLIQHYEVMSHAEQTNRPYLIRKLLAGFIALGYRLPFRQVAVSNWIREKINNPACAVIPNGIDINAFSPLDSPRRPSAKFVIGVIESDSTWKGYAPFLAALNALPALDKSEIFVRIASRAEVGLPEEIESERLRPQSDKEMAEFYCGCDTFVFTSFIEGFGLPPLEAMACGVPVLTTDCGGVREYANENNAVIVPPGNVLELTTAILRLKQEKDLRENLRSSGLETAKSHSLSVMLQKHIAWIEAL